MFAHWSHWQYILTFVLGVILYDQGKRGLMARWLLLANNKSSDVYQAKGFYCRADFQNSTYGALHSSPSPKI